MKSEFDDSPAVVEKPKRVPERTNSWIADSFYTVREKTGFSIDFSLR